jgi:hypothetical protein
MNYLGIVLPIPQAPLGDGQTNLGGFFRSKKT